MIQAPAPAVAALPTVLQRLALRAGLVVAAFVVALVVWPSLRSPLPSRPEAPPAQVGAAIGSSLGLLVLALVLATVAAVAVTVVGALAVRAEAEQSWIGGLASLAGGLAGLPWVAVSPFALAVALAVPAGVDTAAAAGLAAVIVAGLPATLGAAAACDRLRLGDLTGAVGAAAAGLGRGAVAGAGALVLVEAALNRPGLGRLLVLSAVDRSVDGSTVVVLLVIGLVGSLVAVLGDGATAWRPPADPNATSRAQRGWLLAAAAGLAVPVLLFLVSFAVAGGGIVPLDVASALQPSSPAHPLGTDQLGRDLLALVMAGYRTSLGEAFGAALLAAAIGGLWGGAAAWLALRGRAAGALADVLVAPAWVVALLPLVPVVVVLRVAQPGAASAVLVGVGLLARLALAVRDLDPSDLSPATLGRAAAGVFLLCLGVAFVAGVGVDGIGFGATPPGSSLGLVLSDMLPALRVVGGGAVTWSVWLSVLTAGPCLFAGWTLLGSLGRAQAWGRLSA